MDQLMLFSYDNLIQNVFRGIAVCAILFNSGCTTRLPVCPAQIPEYADHSLLLSPNEIENLQVRLDSGDSAAAYRMYQHYAGGLGHQFIGELWLKRAAALGSTDAKRELGFMLLRERSEELSKQGAAMLYEASQSGDKRADQYIRSDQKMSSQYRLMVDAFKHPAHDLSPHLRGKPSKE